MASSTALPSSGAFLAEDWAEVERLLLLARTHLGMEIAWMSQFSNGEQVIRAASGDVAAMNVTVDAGTPLDGSFCVRVLAGTLPPVISDARRHPVTRDLDVTDDLGIGSYVGVPLRAPNGEIAGMLCCLSRSASPGLDEQASAFLALIADLVSDHLGSATATARRAAHQGVQQIRSLLERRAVRMEFQPVVRLSDGACVAVEALARFDDPTFPSPDLAFAAATRAGLGVELEQLAVQLAVEQLADVPAGAWLNVNLSAEALLAPAVQELLLAHADRRIGVEVTEHTQVQDYAPLVAVTNRLRSAGLQIVVDDAGAGFASFRHILKLCPDVIKLDIGITRDVDTDPVRQALTRSLVAFAGDVSATLVAEGIETRAEHDTLRGLQVRLGQGYLMARPGPLPALSSPVPVPAAVPLSGAGPSTGPAMPVPRPCPH